MSNFNPNYPQQQLNDGLCSIEMLKSLVDNPLQVPSTMYQFTNYQHRALADYQFMVKYLQEVYNPPDNNLQLSKQRQQDLHLMRPPDSSQIKKVPIDNKTAKPIIEQKKQPEKFFQPLVFPKGYGFPPPVFPPVFQNPKAMFSTPVVNPFEPAPPVKAQVEVNKGINAKRKPQNPAAASLYEYPQKKLKGTGQGKSPVPKNAKIIELDDDDDDEAEIIPKETVQNRTKKAKNVKSAIHPFFRTGDKKNQPYKAPIEIIDSPELISKEQFMIEEEKDGATTNATNFDDFNDNTKDGESKDEGGVLDIFDLNIDDLGIKILGEVFLCDKCQREIPQKDVDKGFKETCASCSKKLKTNKSVVGNKKYNRSSATANKEESLKYEQENSVLEDNNNTSSKEDEAASKYDILAPVYQSRGFYEDTTNLNIMNSDQNLRPTALGKMHQTAIIPLNIYAKGKKKKMKKLWNPEKIEHSACKYLKGVASNSNIDEKFRNDVNGKNSVYLLDEEITEILVRFKYNIEQALTWSMKSNPEFQYYVKKSANRRRIMTRGTGRGYSNIYE